MAKHSFAKDVRDHAKSTGQSLIAFTFDGKSFRWDLESPVDNAVGEAIACMMVKLFAAHLTDPSLVPTFEAEIVDTIDDEDE